MIKKKYKFVSDVKTSKFDDIETRIVSENKITENNSITKNKKFEQIDGEVIQKYIKKIFFSSVSNNTHQKNSLRICRIVNSVDYEVQNFVFHQTRYIF